MGERPPEFVEGLAKGLAVLEAFGQGRPEMTLSEVARAVGISPPAARRSLLTLACLGYVGQRGRTFFLRPKVMALGSAFYFSAGINDVLLPELRRLVDLWGDASSVATLDGADVIYVAHQSQQRARRATAVVGARYPAHATSMGRILLAGLPDASLSSWLDSTDLVALTSQTVTDKGTLRALLLEVRERGFATAVDQLDYGVTAIAVPIRNAEGATVAALNSSGYTGHVTADKLVAERLAELRVSASRISLSLLRNPLMEAVLKTS